MNFISFAKKEMGLTFSFYIYKSLESNNIIYKYIDLDHL